MFSFVESVVETFLGKGGKKEKKKKTFTWHLAICINYYTRKVGHDWNMYHVPGRFIS